MKTTDVVVHEVAGEQPAIKVDVSSCRQVSYNEFSLGKVAELSQCGHTPVPGSTMQ